LIKLKTFKAVPINAAQSIHQSKMTSNFTELFQFSFCQVKLDLTANISACTRLGGFGVLRMVQFESNFDAMPVTPDFPVTF
jgi:hypothetical protein